MWLTDEWVTADVLKPPAKISILSGGFVKKWLNKKNWGNFTTTTITARGNSTDMTILSDVIKPQTLSNEGLCDKRAFKGVNIWRGVNTLLPDKPIRFQMVFKFDLGGQSTWPGKHNTFKRVLKLRVVHTLWVTLPNLLLQGNRTSLCSYPYGLPSGTHCWDPWAMRTTFTPTQRLLISH